MFRKTWLLIGVLILTAGISFAQKTVSKKVIFAVLNDGKTIEPIAFVDKAKLSGIGEEQGKDKPFDLVKGFYKPKSKLNLIFAGANAGSATIVKDFADSDCAANQAEISISSSKVKPKGFLMALATNIVPKKNEKLIRKMPTAAERKSINELVFQEMKSKKVPIKNVGELRYHNLTKIDVDGDGNSEFVGTYWYNTGAKKRSLLFFIGESDASGTITIPFTEFSDIDEENVMSGEIKALDDGVYHELFLDMLDYDGDGQSEIFTMSQGFEGSNFNAYKRIDGKWTMILETSNYHCGY